MRHALEVPVPPQVFFTAQDIVAQVAVDAVVEDNGGKTQFGMAADFCLLSSASK